MKNLWGCEVLLNAFVTVTLGRSEWSGSSPGCIIPVGMVNYIGWVPELMQWQRKNLCVCQE